ncbi:type I polyketide synthase [Rosistilla carotiformis]|uniref:type I polyketide synthase n=1 Tax=Rosistilla carotiformis TaxID=2528017 RepID=UPI00119CEC20|nr:type I polyketide synthase [Rosistilla carotiformis]
MLPTDIFVATVPRLASIDLAIAACRAGAIGTLDFAWNHTSISASIDRLARFTNNPFAARIDQNTKSRHVERLAQHAAQLDAVILAGEITTQRVATLRSLLGNDVRLLAEITHSETLQEAIGLPLDGVILKGNEAGGWVASETTFLLLQRWARLDDATRQRLPAYAQGGIGPHTAAACEAAGARGVVIDSQVLLAQASPLSTAAATWVRSYDGSQTHLLGEALGRCFRFAAPPSAGLVQQLRELELNLLAKQESAPDQSFAQAWTDGVEQAVAANDDPRVLIAGQDLAFAAGLAQRCVDVRGTVTAIIDQSRENIQAAAEVNPLDADGPLAASHGIGLPIVQGPMTRVSDTAEFAEAVASEGGLPLIALALMRGPEASKILAATRAKLGDRGWGAGLLGFLPPEIRNEQIAAIREHRPPVALIAGGRPDQAKELEALDIPTYLHAPSPGLLEMFLRDDARRFVFEGRECGGHVGPRSSFVLWESLLVVLEAFAKKNPREVAKLHLLFAGGIHDGLSAAMATSVAGRLSQLGAKVGVLMGSAYLFTKEAVEAGAIVPRFQEEAIRSHDTVLLETGPGHAIRCIRTPYRDLFDRERRRLAGEGKTADEITRELEWMNIGRLRVASKGIERSTPSDGGKSKLENVSSDKQYERGMYMVGQVAALRDSVTTIGQLHADVSQTGTQRLQQASANLNVAPKPSFTDSVDAPPPCDIAIVGMSAMYPGGNELAQYWENILNKHYAVTEVPRDSHWDWTLFYDPDPRAPDKIVSKWGGFLTDQVFNPFEYGITPRSIASIEPLQLLLLESMKRTLADGGYDRRPFNRETACAVLGIGGGGSPMGVMYGIRSSLPIIETAPELPIGGQAIYDAVKNHLPEWTEDSFPGILMNVAVGRVANRFNLGGSNYALDAACASSLAAVHACIRELQLGTTDVAFAMGADTVQTPYAFMAFSKTHALSPQGRCRPFDAEADGIVLSEGLGIVMLKRLADAERDGDKIYAVIRGIGSSSDGKDKGLTAPNATGQIRALRRAYEQARVEPSSIGLVEAHGTGTVVGDRTEATSVATVLDESGARRQSVAIGSVKSMIGHSKCAAGVAGLIKAAMALHTKTLPPTLVETPSPAIDFPNTGLYLNTETRPWINGEDHPRRAGVSAFGFGGTNVHLVLEEYTEDFANPPEVARAHWPAELLVWRAANPAALRTELTRIHAWLAAGVMPELPELAASLADAFEKTTASGCVAAIVAKDLGQLTDHLAIAIEKCEATPLAISDPRGIYLAEIEPETAGKVALLFPGQGAQYPDMLAELLLAFPAAHAAVDHAAAVYDEHFASRFAQLIYPPSPFTDADRDANRKALADTAVAQPALAATSWAALQVIDALGIRADVVGGHSFGELVAVAAAEALTYDDLLSLAAARGDAMRSAAQPQPDGGFAGAMAAVSADAATIQKELSAAGLAEAITIANDNSPQQIVISGPIAAVDSAIEKLTAAGMRVVKLDVSCAFHSPQVAAAGIAFAEKLESLAWKAPQRTVYSNTTAAKHPAAPAEMLATLKSHLASPVRFRQQVAAMYADGVRTFIEVGPGSALTGLVGQTLQGHPHTAVSIDRRGRDSLTQLVHTLGRLITAGVDGIRPSALFAARAPQRIDLRKLNSQIGHPDYPKNAWMVNGMRNRPINEPEKHYLGQRHPDADKPRPAATGNGQPAKQEPAAKPSAAAATAKPIAAAAELQKPQQVPPQKPRQTKPLPPAASAAPQRPQKPTAPTPVVPSDQNTMQRTSSATNRLPQETNGSAQAPAAAYHDEATAVMLGYQQLMRQFLQTQRDVMVTYLQGEAPEADNGMLPQAAQPQIAQRPQPTYAAISHNGENGHAAKPAPAVPAAAPVAAAPPTAAAPAPAPAPTAAPEPTPAAPTPAAATPAVAQPAAAAPTDNGQAAPASIQQAEEALLELVADRTGYPVDMLDMEADLEGDLGIDSIKRVEILGNLAEVLQLAGDGEDLQDTLELEKLTTLRTLQGIVDYLEEAIFSDDAKKKVKS